LGLSPVDAAIATSAIRDARDVATARCGGTRPRGVRGSATLMPSPVVVGLVTLTRTTRNS